jgi:hypothetical protein
VPGLSFPIVAFVVSATLFAPLASWLALQRARPWALWFLFGVGLGPVASLLLILAPPGRCPACDTRTVGWPRSCANCGLIFGSEESGALRFASRPRLPAAATSMAGAIGPAGLAPVVRSARAPRGAAGATLLANAAVRRDTAPPVRAMLTGRADIVAESPGRRSAMGLGRRPSDGSAAPRPVGGDSSPANESASLGSGVFIGGSESLQIGSRYLLARVGSELHVLGPVHVNPEAIAVRVPLGDVEPTVVADRLFIAPVASGRGPDLAFGAVLLERGVDLGNELQGAGRSWSPPT